MKLAGKLSNPQIILRTCQALERSLEKVWLLTFDEVYLKISPSKTSSASALIEYIFEEYLVESKLNNRIWLEISSTHFTRAIKSGEHSVGLWLKLVKKDGYPVLKLTIHNKTKSGSIVTLAQEVPVKVTGPNEIAERIPSLHQPLHLLKVKMPDLDTLRKVLDRMTKFNPSHIVRIWATNENRFILKAKNNYIELESEFTRIPDVQNSSERQEGAAAATTGAQVGGEDSTGTTIMEVTVDGKDLSRCLAISVLRPTGVECLFFGQCMTVQGFIEKADGSGLHLVKISQQIALREDC